MTWAEAIQSKKSLQGVALLLTERATLRHTKAVSVSVRKIIVCSCTMLLRGGLLPAGRARVPTLPPGAQSDGPGSPCHFDFPGQNISPPAG